MKKRPTPNFGPNHAPLLTIDEAAVFLKVSRPVLFRLIRKGKIPSFKIGDLRRFRVESLAAWAEGLEAAQVGATVTEAPEDVEE